MSVINQMLRDLDQRGKVLGSESSHAGVRSVEQPMPPVPVRRAQRPIGVALGFLGLCGIAGGIWYSGWMRAASPGEPIASSAPAAQPAAVPVSSVVVSLPVPESPKVADASAAASPAKPSATVIAPVGPQPDVALRMEAALDRGPKSVAAPPSQSAATPAVRTANSTQPEPLALPPVPKTSAPVATSTTPPSAVAKIAGSQPAAPAPSVATPSDKPDSAARQLAAGREALLHAQTLWTQGQQGTAVELLRDALAQAERGAGVAGMDAMAVSMARELARMYLSSGRVQEAYDLLVQQESATRNIPEVWAMRANAAQRLGNHADSVQAYMQALQSRPNEQRWLLGLAVSMAALGQIQAAGDVAERARLEGPVPRDIANYLRQMGVVLR